MLIEITGRNYWKFHAITDPSVGHASISVDGTPAYEGKRTAKGFSFEIADLQGNPILTSSSESPSRWRGFLGHGSQVIRDNNGAEVARVMYDGLFGFRRTCVVGSKTVRWPQSHTQHVELPGATITIDIRRRSARAEISDQTNQIAYLGLVFYIWM